MKRYRNIIFQLLILWFPGCPEVYPCTGINAPSSQGILVGSNEDYNSTYKDIIARIRPATEGKYGYLATGFQRHDFFMIAINDQGLFIDLFTVPFYFPWIHHPDKLDYNGFLEGKLLEECADVEQAIAFLRQYNTVNMATNLYQIYVVDKSGKSAVINWADGDIEVVRAQEEYQVVTNFFLLHPECGSYPCWRYITASEKLKNAAEFSFRLIHDIIEEVNLGSNYSQISNLTKGEMYLFNNHNFDEFITLNLSQEIQKGAHDYFLPDYFSQVKLLAPADKEIVPSSNKVTFKWEGLNTSTYQISYATDPDFKNCRLINIISRHSQRINGISGATLILGSIFFFILFPQNYRRRFFQLSIIFMLIFSSMIACERDNFDNTDPAIEVFSETVAELQSGVTYYWKVMATAGSDINTESIVRTFTIGGE